MQKWKIEKENKTFGFISDKVQKQDYFNDHMAYNNLGMFDWYQLRKEYLLSLTIIFHFNFDPFDCIFLEIESQGLIENCK